MSGTAIAKAPNIFWTLSEGRAIFELGAFRLMRRSLLDLPKGDGHSVLFLPGFMGTDNSTKIMRKLFAELNYSTHGWGLGRNLKFNDVRERAMSDVVERIYERQNAKISIVGWSLGGVFARELAKIHPDLVRSVISLGSPISNDRRYSAPNRLFELFNRDLVRGQAEKLTRDLETAPPLPTTSIMTKTDGIVSWRGSVQCPTKGNQVENIIVPASHIGLGMNPFVMIAVADRLAQDKDRWIPFDRSGWRELFYRDATQ